MTRVRGRDRQTQMIFDRARVPDDRPTVAQIYRWRIAAAKTDGDARLVADLERALAAHRHHLLTTRAQRVRRRVIRARALGRRAMQTGGGTTARAPYRTALLTCPDTGRSTPENSDLRSQAGEDQDLNGDRGSDGARDLRTVHPGDIEGTP